MKSFMFRYKIIAPQANCLLECLLEYTVSNLNLTARCLPWFFPPLLNEKMCDPWTAREFDRVARLMPSDQCNGCLPDCEDTLYSASVTAAPFRR